MDVIYSIGARFGGAGIGTVACNAAREIERRGYLKKVICWSDENSGIRKDKISTVLPMGAFISRLPFHGSVDNCYDWLSSFHVSDCDVFHGWNNHSLISLRKAKAKNAKIFIERASSHILGYKELVAEEYGRFGVNAEAVERGVVRKCLQEYEECDYVLVPSEFAYESFMERKFDKEKLIKIPFGVDSGRFRPMKKKDSVFRVLFVGQVIMRKGLQYLLEAFSELNLKNAELVVKGKVQAEMRGIVGRYGKLRNLRLTSWVEDLPRLYSSASVFVLPSIEEGSALVTYEAMASGLPVITTPNAGSVVRDGKDGFIIPVRDVESLKESILYFYNNSQEAEKMGRNARKNVEKYTWKRYGEKVCEAYEMAVG